MIAHPPQMSPQQLLAIDNFVLSGQRALVFVDPLSELVQQGNPQAAASASDLGPLLKSWGVDYPANMVLLDRATGPAGGGQQRSARAGDRLSALAASDAAGFRSARSRHRLAAVAQPGLEPARWRRCAAPPPIFHTLIGSSDQANMMPRAQLMNLRDPTHLIDSVEPTGVRYALAARITGPAKTAFPKAPGAVQKGNVQLIIVADSDIWDDRFWVHVSNQLGQPVAEPFADNGAFILNAVENLTGSDDLISLRTRASSDRPFTVVQALQAKRPRSNTAETEDRCRPTSPRRSSALEQLQQGAGGNGHRADPEAEGRDRDAFAAAWPDATPAARRAAQSARGGRRAGRPARLPQYLRRADPGGGFRAGAGH